MLNAITMPASRPDIRKAVGLSVASMDSVPAVQWAKPRAIKKAIGLAAHDRGGEAAEHPEARVLPQERARQGQEGMGRIAVAARRVAEAVPGRPHGGHDRVVEPAVRIGEMKDAGAEPLLQVAPGSDRLLQ